MNVCFFRFNAHHKLVKQTLQSNQNVTDTSMIDNIPIQNSMEYSGEDEIQIYTFDSDIRE